MTQRPEEYGRSAVSRACYGMFGVIRERLEGQTGRRFTQDRSVHSQVIEALIADTRPEFKEVGQNLDRLRRERNRADYDGRTPFSANEARLAVALARQIESQVPELK